MTFQSEQINELAAALAKAQGEMENAKKDADNSFFKSKYADLASVVDAAKPALAKHGLAVIQSTQVFPDNDKTVLITQLCHSSGQWIRSWYPINPVKNDPQGMGSAHTYARRYSYSAIVGIAAEDDDGNEASGKANVVRGNPKKANYAVEVAKLEDGSKDFDGLVGDIETMLEKAKTPEEVSLINRSNAKHLKEMQDEYPDLFMTVGAAFKKRGQELM